MPDQPTVSVVIPAHNAESTLPEAIHSALAQTCPAREIIVVDDGSTDQTPEVIASFGDRVRSIRLEKTGLPAAARNAGIAIATGEWIAFLDADDLWEPAKLESQLQTASRSASTVLVYTDRWNIGEVDRTTARLSDSLELFEGDVFTVLLKGNFITTSSVLVERAALQAQSGFREDPLLRGCEDWDLWLRISAAGGEFALCRQPLTRYRLHEGTVSGSHLRMCRGRLATVRQALASERGRSLPRRIARDALARAWSCSAWHIAPANRWKALGWYMRSSWQDPRDINSYKGAIKCALGRTG